MVRRVVLVVTTWSVGTVLAMGLVWWAVDQVSSEVVNRPPAPISNHEVAAALGADPGAGATTTTVPAGPGGPGAAPTSTPPTSATGSGSATTTTATGPPAGGPVPTTSTSTPATTAAPAPAQEATTATIDSVGGQVAVRYEAGGVALVWARPKAGFEAEVHASGPETVEVRFESDDHESRVRAFWSDGVPEREVREQEDGGDDEG